MTKTNKEKIIAELKIIIAIINNETDKTMTHERWKLIEDIGINTNVSMFIIGKNIEYYIKKIEKEEFKTNDK